MTWVLDSKGGGAYWYVQVERLLERRSHECRQSNCYPRACRPAAYCRCADGGVCCRANDLYVDNADGNQSVLRTIKEGHNLWRTYDGPPLARDRWESYEVYLFIDNQSVDAGGKGRFRVWRDGTLIFDRTDVPTISTPDGTIK